MKDTVLSLHTRDWPLRRKLLLIVIATIVVSLALVISGIAVYELSTHRSRLAHQVTELSRFIAANSASALAFDDAGTAQEILATLKATPQIVAAALYKSDGRQFAAYARPDSTQAVLPASPGPDDQRFVGDFLQLVLPVEQKGRRLGTLYLSASTTEVSWAPYTGILLIVSLAIGGSAVLLQRLLRRMISEPLIALSQTAERMAGGDLTASVPIKSREMGQPVFISGNDEITALARSFEYMRLSLRDRLVALRDVEASLLRTNADLEQRIAERARAEAETHAAYRQLQATHEQMVQMEKLSALGTLVGGVAHEINNPLMGIKGYIEYVTERLGAGRPKEILQRASSEVDRISRIVKNMLVFARSNASFATDEVNLVQAVRNTSALVDADLRHQKIELRIITPEMPVLARCNLDNMQQVLLNLILNARDALKDRPLPRTLDISVSGNANGHCTISVTDNGPGVPESIRNKIFDPFFTTKPAGQGTGLGLAVSRQLIDASGGTLELGAAPHGGASFVITVKALEKASA